MADKYVRSTDGNNADSGASWALAYADLHTPTWAAGDRVFVSQAHNPAAIAGAITMAFAGTAASPTQVIGANDAAEPPTALSTAPVVSTSGTTSTITFTGTFYCYGITFLNGSGSSGATTQLCGTTGTTEQQTFESCKFRFGGSGSQPIALCTSGATSGKRVDWINVDVKFSAAAQRINQNGAMFDWRGGSIESGSTALTTNGLILIAGRGGSTRVQDVDLTNLGVTGFLASSTNYGAGLVQFRRCKLPAWTTGGVFTGAVSNFGTRVELIDCLHGTTRKPFYAVDYAGTIDTERTIVKTGGSSDGAAISAKMSTNANAKFPSIPLSSFDIDMLQSIVGSSVTLSVDVVHDSQGSGTGGRLTNSDCWIEVEFLGTASSSLGSQVSGRRNPLSSQVDHADSAATWTTTGMTTPRAQTLSVSFTQQTAGSVVVRLILAKASAVVYSDLKPSVA